MTQEIEREALPPLPNPVRWEEAPPGIAANGWPQGVYTADQMHAYARAALSMKAPAEPVAWGCFFPDGRLEPDLVGCEKDCIYWRDADDATNKWTVKPLYAAQPPVDEREALREIIDNCAQVAEKRGEALCDCWDDRGAYQSTSLRDFLAALNQVESDSGEAG